jgi:imidazole glycerol-phosphate synthase subunit HisF
VSLPRLIPVLLIREGGLWKSRGFRDFRYVGDISNSISIFSEKEVDELLILDTQASMRGEGPNFHLLEKVLTRAFVPVTYGGGVRTTSDARRLVEIGVDRVSINSGFLGNHHLVSDIAAEIGQSSASISLDVSGGEGAWLVKGLNSGDVPSLESSEAFLETLKRVDDSGAGQLLVQDVDRDGTQLGFRQELIDFVMAHSKTPLVFGGGLASMEDAYLSWSKGVSGVAVGSKFVFVGNAMAVMLNYPNRENFQWI